MFRARLARLWLQFCESDVQFDALGRAYYVGDQRAADPVSPCPAMDVDDEWLSVAAIWTAASGFHRPEGTG